MQNFERLSFCLIRTETGPSLQRWSIVNLYIIMLLKVQHETETKILRLYLFYLLLHHSHWVATYFVPNHPPTTLNSWLEIFFWEGKLICCVPRFEVTNSSNFPIQSRFIDDSARSFNRFILSNLTSNWDDKEVL